MLEVMCMHLANDSGNAVDQPIAFDAPQLIDRSIVSAIQRLVTFQLTSNQNGSPFSAHSALTEVERFQRWNA